ncbi:glycosyltransferase [Methylosinus sp. Ce-a6]|uniref:glycosyltransferase n=1 Tax=Methylosinus sp. Ce-a6 TaxID=2172005 RepID=UPI0013594B27|nr:glycosyltransferase [Methylosinus sp. Ce-a6]
MVHAAWHSCGSYQVNVGQLQAYRALGARTLSVALMDAPAPRPPRGARWEAYFAASADLAADKRYFCGPSRWSALAPRFLAHAWWRLIHGDQATWLVELAKIAALPPGLEDEQIDLVHTNHYFTLPFVARMLRGRTVPVMLETQDIQARQYILRNQGGFFVPPYATYEDMLSIELEWMRAADVCVHLNEEERAEFALLLPQARHRLVYPAIAPVPCGPGGERIVIVASDNYGNFVSLRWFLREVAPLAPGVEVEIYGNIDAGVRSRDKALYDANRRLFKGRVDDIGAVYAQAACVLLPTIEGHGLSVKAVEAMASGAPLIATRRAFRGMAIDPEQLSNVTLADTAGDFAAAVRAAGQRREQGPREASDSRRLYDEMFSPDAYARALHEAAAPLLSS